MPAPKPRSGPPPRHVLYTRVSTHEQDSNNSHDSQLAALQRHADERGAVVVRVIRETASGGNYIGRPGIRAALELIDSGEADVLACYDFSRYSRDEEHQQAIARRVARAGGRIEFTNLELARDEGGDLTPESQLMFGVSGSFAAYHRAKIRADTMRGKREAALKGRASQRRSPFGYHIVVKSDVLRGDYSSDQLGLYFIVENEATIVREIFERRARGESLKSISRDLNERKIMRRGKSWRISAISSLMSNAVYRGSGAHGRTRRVHDESRLERGFTRDFSYARRDDKDVIEFDVPAIVSDATWNACASLRGTGARGALGDRRCRHLLSSILVCPRCGGKMVGCWKMRAARGPDGRTGRPKPGQIRKPPPKVRRRFYICRGAKLANGEFSQKCLGRIFPADPFDETILATLRQIADAGTLGALRARRDNAQSRKVEQQRAEINAQIDAIEQRERDLIAAQIAAMSRGLESETYLKLLDESGRDKRELQSARAILKLRAVPTQTNAQLKQSVEQIGAMLSTPNLLEPASEQLQTLHNFLASIFERIEFDDLGPEKIGGIRIIPR